MKTLEVARLNIRTSGGALRASKIIAMRRATGAETFIRFV